MGGGGTESWDSDEEGDIEEQVAGRGGVGVAVVGSGPSLRGGGGGDLGSWWWWWWWWS